MHPMFVHHRPVNLVLVEHPLAVELLREDVSELQLRGVELVPPASRVLPRRALGRHQLAVRLVLHQPVHEVVSWDHGLRVNLGKRCMRFLRSDRF